MAHRLIDLQQIRQQLAKAAMKQWNDVIGRVIKIFRGRLNAVGIALLIAAALVPTLSVHIPAMEDYLDHLSRMYVLTTAGTESANPYYQVSWALYPNLAIDLIVPTLAKFLEVETATKIFFFASQLLVISGTIALELSLKPRHEFAAYAALLSLYSMPFTFGFVNFEFGVGVSLWSIAAWIALTQSEKWRLRFLVHVLFSAILFLAHFFALGIYGLTVGIIELRRLVKTGINIQRTLKVIIILASPVAVMLLLMLWSGATLGETSDNVWWFRAKPIWLLLFLNGYEPTLAVSSLCAITTLLVSGFMRKNLQCSSNGKWIAIGFFIVFIAMPFKLASSRMADFRMITAALLIIPAFMTWEHRKNSLGYIPVVVTVFVILINSTYVGYIWLGYQNDYRAIKASFALLRRNSLILVASSPAPDVSSTVLMQAPMWRAPTLAVHYANAFVSSLYTLIGTHAVSIRRQWRYLALNGENETYEPPSMMTLTQIAEGANVPGAPKYIHNWQRDFDYLYLLGPRAPNMLPNLLAEIATDRRFTLYRVRRKTPDQGQQPPDNRAR